MQPYREQPGAADGDRSVIVAALNGHVVGIDRATGQVRWQNSLPGGGLGEVFIGFRYGVLVVSSSRDELYRLDYQTGQTLWQVTTTASGRATILVEADLIIVGKSGYLDAFDHLGRHWWRQQLEGKGRGGLALALPGNVAQADDVGTE